MEIDSTTVSYIGYDITTEARNDVDRSDDETDEQRLDLQDLGVAVKLVHVGDTVTHILLCVSEATRWLRPDIDRGRIKTVDFGGGTLDRYKAILNEGLQILGFPARAQLPMQVLTTPES